MIFKNIVRIANPIASAAATKINKEKICPDKSKNIRESTKFMLAERSTQFNRHKNSKKDFFDLQKYLKSQ